MNSNEPEELYKEGERVFRVRDGKSRSRAHSKREKRKQNKAWQRRKWEEGLKNENFRVPEREELPQEEKNYEKTRGPELQKMPEEGKENEKVRESESEKVAEPLTANKKRIEANKPSPKANTFSRGKVMVNLSHSKLKRKGHTEEKAKISRKQIEVSSRKSSIVKNADALAFKEINRSLQKVDKSQKIGNGTFGNCYIALYRNEYRVIAKEIKIIIESPKKTREEVWREASAITGIGDHWGIPLCLVFSQIGHHFIWFFSSTLCAVKA